MRLLTSATTQDVQHAMQATAGSLQEFMMHVFRAIAALLELAKRRWPAVDGRDEPMGHGSGPRRSNMDELDKQQQQQQQPTGSHGSGSDSVSAASADRGDDPGLRSSSTDHPACDTGSGSATAATAAAAVAAAAAICVDEDSRGCDALRAASAAAQQELEWHVDHYLRMVVLMLLHNPMAVYAVVATNMVTRETAAAPPQHWLQVSGCCSCSM
jgi:hypothetical protein